ncbi:MAG: sugar phosphate nucleotidyltransferase [Clostridia bacterium]|jgi:NDP-sugar pyrophosphorylase family protein|nr:sugar phosphate nucleotidyltransferase [Clostridia bacterium]
MVGIILCAGKGSRISNLDCPNKCLLKFQGISLLQRTLSYMNSINEISRVIIVVNHNKDDVITEARKSTFKELIIIEQKNLNGIVGAIEKCIPAINTDDFMLMLGDEYYDNPKYEDFISYFANSKLSILVGVVYVYEKSRISNTYSIHTKGAKLIYFEEKPKNVSNNIMGTGTILFRNTILTYINRVEVNKQRKERDLVDLLNISLKDNKSVQMYEISKYYFNVNDNYEIENLNTYLINREGKI